MRFVMNQHVDEAKAPGELHEGVRSAAGGASMLSIAAFQPLLRHDQVEVSPNPLAPGRQEAADDSGVAADQDGIRGS